MPDRVRQRLRVGGDVRRKGFAAHVLHIDRGFVRRMAVTGMLVVMPMLAVGSLHQGPGDGVDPVEMDEEESAQCERCGGVDRSRRGAAEVFHVAEGDQLEEFRERYASEDIAEPDEEENRPKERHEFVRVLLEGGAEDLDAHEFQDRFEEILRPCRRGAVGPGKQFREDQEHQPAGDESHQALIREPG